MQRSANIAFVCKIEIQMTHTARNYIFSYECDDSYFYTYL